MDKLIATALRLTSICFAGMMGAIALNMQKLVEPENMPGYLIGLSAILIANCVIIVCAFVIAHDLDCD